MRPPYAFTIPLATVCRLKKALAEDQLGNLHISYNLVLCTIMSFSNSPFEAVRQELWQHTDRNPIDTAAITALIYHTLVPLDDAKPFIEKLINHLDPYAQESLGANAAETLEGLTDMVKDPDVARQRRWGALSLLGALGTVHSPALTEAHPLEIVRNHREQVGAHVARNALINISSTPELHEDFRNAASGLLLHTDYPPEDAAVQLHDVLATLETKSAPDTHQIAQPPAGDVANEKQGSRIGEPYHAKLVGISSDMTDKFSKMDWLTLDESGVPAIDSVMRDLYHDGKKVALLADLTGGHHTLSSLMQDLLNDPKQSRQFWPQLAATIVHYLENGRGKRLLTAKVMAFTMSNKGSNEDIVRAYFTPLGRREDGTRIIALIAACRTKGNQERVLRLLTNVTQKKYKE